FPLLSDIQLNPAEVDVLAPRHVQLHQVGLLRHLTQHDHLQNTDPEFNILEQSLNAGFSGYDEVDFDAIEDLVVEHAATEAGAESKSHSREQENEDDEDTTGSRSDSADEWTPPSNTKRKRKRNTAPKTAKRRRRNSRTAVYSGKTTNATGAPPLPSVSYEKSLPAETRTEKFHALRPPNLSSKQWKAERKRQYNLWWQGRKHASSVEVHTAQDGFDVPQHSRISKPAWMGLRASADVRGSIQDAIAERASDVVHTILEGITRIPYVPNRMFLYRSQLTPNILGRILPDVNTAVPKFVRSITHGFSEDDMQNNSRGDHWFSIAGHDRNNRQSRSNLPHPY
ncbi:MAG: hypothetical protein NXY57DRAFT_1044856, partial [Lentinula lateritia]